MTTKENLIIPYVDEKNIPSVINRQFYALQQYRNNVDVATRKASNALGTAQYAHGKSAGLFQKKEAIESLQEAVVDVADAQVAAAEAQEVSFEYQQKLGECCKYLFGLGVSNIASNRSVVRELELRLKGASEEELDELARQEIAGVIRQLKAQEDIMEKQQELSGKVKNHDGILDSLKEKSSEHDIKIKKEEDKDKFQDAEIARQARKDEEHDRRLNEGDKKDKAQDAEMARQAQKDEEHDRRLNAGDEKDEAQDAEMARQAQKDEEHDRYLSELCKEEENQLQLIKELQSKVVVLEKKCATLNDLIESNDSEHKKTEENLDDKIESRFTKRASIISAIVGAAGLIVAIISFFL